MTGSIKKILLTTDFSIAAQNASRYALELFGRPRFDQTVEFTLLNVCHQKTIPDPVAGPYTGSPAAPNEDDLRYALDRLEEECTFWQGLYPDISIQTSLLAGEIIAGITKTVREQHIDLIVMGSTGTNRVDRLLFGSIAYQTLLHTPPKPVLMIPQGAPFKHPEKLVFATDFKALDNLEKLAPLQQLVQDFLPEFILLHFYSRATDSESERTMMNGILRQYFDCPKYRTHFQQNDNPAKGIEQFIQEQKPDLLALVAQERNFLQRLFHRSVSRRLLSHAQIPLLLLGEKKSRSTATNDHSSIVQEQLHRWNTQLEQFNLRLHLQEGAPNAFQQQKAENGVARLEELKRELSEATGIEEEKWQAFHNRITTALEQFKTNFLA